MKRAGSMSTTRLRKVHCADCGYIVRVSRTCIERGLPTCFCGQRMECADIADAIECGLFSLDQLPRTVRTQLCRENGWEDEIIRTSPGRRSKPRACLETGCGRFVRAGELHCEAHVPADMPF